MCAERRNRDQLDRCWDDVVGRGGVAPDPSLNSGTVMALRRLDQLNTAALPVTTSDRIWARAQGQMIPRQTIPQHRHQGRAPGTAPRRLALPRALPQRTAWVTTVATVAVLLLTLAGGALIPNLASRSATTDGAVPVDLYVGNGSGWHELRRLDPSTLADMGSEAVIDFASPSANMFLSADGTTLVRIAYAWDGDPQWSVVVHDGLTGPERNRFALPGEPHHLTVSDDGSRLVLSTVPHPMRTSDTALLARWLVYETATGDVLSDFEIADRCCADAIEQTKEVWIDADGVRLYRLVFAGTGPILPDGDVITHPNELIAYDLLAGTEVVRRHLTAEVAAIWQNGYGQRKVEDYFEPAVALTPDGSRLLMVHPELTVVSLIDTRNLTVTETIVIRPEQGALDRLRALLPLPQSAAAKGAAEGTTLRATVSGDGRHLYVSGFDYGGFGPGNLPIFEGRGLRVIDLTSGTVSDAVLPGVQIDTILPTPDGARLYVFAPHEPHGQWVRPIGDQTYSLWLLDAETLAVETEREFFGWRPILLVPET